MAPSQFFSNTFHSYFLFILYLLTWTEWTNQLEFHCKALNVTYLTVSEPRTLSLVILCIFSQQICWNIFAPHPCSHLPGVDGLVITMRRRRGGGGSSREPGGRPRSHVALYRLEGRDANTTLILSALLSLRAGEDTDADALIRSPPGSIIWKKDVNINSDNGFFYLRQELTK